MPYIAQLAPEVFTLVGYPNEDVRQAAIGTITNFVVALSKSNLPQAQEGNVLNFCTVIHEHINLVNLM